MFSYNIICNIVEKCIYNVNKSYLVIWIKKKYINRLNNVIKYQINHYNVIKKQINVSKIIYTLFLPLF